MARTVWSLLHSRCLWTMSMENSRHGYRPAHQDAPVAHRILSDTPKHSTQDSTRFPFHRPLRDPLGLVVHVAPGVLTSVGRPPFRKSFHSTHGSVSLST